MNRSFLFSLCLIAASVHAQTPTVRVWTDSTSFVVGDRINVHVEFTQSGDATWTPLFADTLGVFSILGRDSIEQKNPAPSITSVTVAAYDSGTAILPPLQFGYRGRNDSTFRAIESNPLVLKIRLVDVDTSKAIKDIKPVLSIPLTIAEISLILGAVIGTVVLAYSIYIYRKRKKAQTPEEKYIPPPKAAHTLALEELATLKEKHLWQQGLIKPYYSEVTEIIRRYFENRYGFMSLEKTTDETLHDLRQYSTARAVIEQTDRILRRADLVKFAKYEPTIPDHEDMLVTAFEIVDRTRVIEAPPVERNGDADAASGESGTAAS